MPALRLSWLIGFRFGSVESKFGMRRSRKLPGSDVHRLRPGRLVPEQREGVGRVERAVLDVPDVAAEPAARQLVLRPVVVAAPAAEQLHAAVAAHVVADAQARRDLVAEAEANGVRRDVGAEGRNRLALGAEAHVDRQPVERPLILHVQRVDVRRRRAARAEVVHLVVAVRAAIRDPRRVAREGLVPPHEARSRHPDRCSRRRSTSAGSRSRPSGCARPWR